MNETTERGFAPAARDALALEFRIERRAELPPMAWALKLVRGERVVHVLAGHDVREADGVFWEGVNPCTDTPRDVVNHHFPLCSGAAIERGALIAFTPGHTLDRVFTLRRDDAIYVSNSLPFLLKGTR